MTRWIELSSSRGSCTLEPRGDVVVLRVPRPDGYRHVELELVPGPDGIRVRLADQPRRER
ncbi:MAG TPA: hypothetical protein VEB22_15260 [Phycisphaerales bacterium]|nr:hypothetical protein [Phycisphaerales bacterium]